jgi:hypothetical protein
VQKQIFIAFLLIFSLMGCQTVGPTSISIGRMSYNEVIQQTSKQQTFANIVRVRHSEPTSFIDINQISAGVTFQGTVMGGAANIGAKAGTSGGTLSGRTGSANISLQYTENPVVQYQPLTGQALISQIATPITVESIGSLEHSDWALASLLSYTVDRLTPGFESYGAALNALISLDSLGVITIAPESIALKSSGADKTSPTLPILAVTLYPQASHAQSEQSDAENRAIVRDLWCRLKVAVGDARPCRPSLSNDELVFASNSVKAPRHSIPNIHFIDTRSAIGILKAILEQPTPMASFIDRGQYEAIRGHWWNRTPGCAGIATYYTLLPAETDPDDFTVQPSKAASDYITRIIEDNSRNEDAPDPIRCLTTTTARLDSNNYPDLKKELLLVVLRRYLLIIKSPTPPTDSYVSYYDGEEWYYIAKTDTISQKNFVLIGQLLTIQATAAPALPITPTVTVNTP